MARGTAAPDRFLFFSPVLASRERVAPETNALRYSRAAAPFPDERTRLRKVREDEKLSRAYSGALSRRSTAVL